MKANYIYVHLLIKFIINKVTTLSKTGKMWRKSKKNQYKFAFMWFCVFFCGSINIKHTIMKKLLFIIILLIPSICYGQKIDENQIDDFTNEQLLTTSWEKLL